MSNSKKPPKWLTSLPLAPEYHPTETEFSDPIAFISKIEKEASQFGICKIIPPFPKPSKRFVLSNLGKSITPTSPAPKFTTRHQEIGQSSQRHLHKQQVWQSGEYYTLEQFESKSKTFRRNQLESFKEVTPILIESLFWKAVSEKPIYVEYANDVPGSGFSVYKKSKKMATELSNSPWNLQAIAKAPGSLTRFMMDEVPGVTSPMVYIGMLFSWFAWHIEDHELHSLNFLHMGAAKTWYAVPRDYASELEEVVRVEGYGGDYDRLEAFAVLGEKTTLLSPEVIVKSGIPCCRLVQHPGEFVVTFPKAYHVGFSHGFNCGEAANFATSQWLKVAKDAAIRRAAMSYLPMLSHQQLLYMLTVSFISRVPRELLSGVRSSRLSDRKRAEREILVKKAFLNDMQNENNRLSSLLQKYSTSYVALWEPDLLSNSMAPLAFQQKVVADDEENLASVPDESSLQSVNISSAELLEILDAEDDDLPCGLNIDSGTLACVACGVLGYPFMAIMQPSEATKIMFESGTCSVSTLLQNPDQFSKSSPVKAVLVSTLEGYNNDVMSVETGSGEKTECVPYNGYNRSRIFCLQHALEIEELLHTKGGAKTTIICHSDYLKIKAYIQATAEEVGMRLNIKDIPLENASPSDLNLISSSIYDGEHEEHSEDWTSAIGVNLKHYLNLRKQSSAKQEYLTLALRRIFSDPFSRSQISTLRWNSRKSRSSYKVVGISVAKSHVNAELDEISTLDDSNETTDNRIGTSINSTLKETDSSSDSLGINRMNDNTVVSYGDHIIDNTLEIGFNECLEDGSAHLLEEQEDSAVQYLDICKADSPMNSKSHSKYETFIETDSEHDFGNNEESNTEPTSQGVITCSNNEEDKKLNTNTMQLDDSYEDREALCVKKYARQRFKRKREEEQTPRYYQRENRRGHNSSNSENIAEGFMRSPCEGLRPRSRLQIKTSMEENQCRSKDRRKHFEIKKDSNLKRKAHDVEKPFSCRWKACRMPFKSAWARTEHERIHTGERPYECKVDECRLTFRYYADFWRHKKKTGHDQFVESSV